MIIAKTRLKKIPERCSKCKFCYMPGGWGVKLNKSMIAEKYKLKSCFLTGVNVPYIYNEKKRNWEYTSVNLVLLKKPTSLYKYKKSLD